MDVSHIGGQFLAPVFPMGLFVSVDLKKLVTFQHYFYHGNLYSTAALDIHPWYQF